MKLRRYRLYLFILLQHMNILTQTFQYFFPSIVGTLGHGSIVTLLLTVPGECHRRLSVFTTTNKGSTVWFATFLTSVLVTWTAAKTKDRSIHIVCLMLASAVGNAIATGTTVVGARFFAVFLMPMGAFSAFAIIVGWIANSFPRPLVKRSVSIAICNMIGNTASIYGSYMYDEAAAPQYVPGGSANAVVCVLVGILAIVLRTLHQRENKKLERAEAEEIGETEDGATTEGRAVRFRYVY